MRSSALCLFFSLSIPLICPVALMPQGTPAPARIVDPIDNAKLVTLKGHRHPLANPANDRGAAPDSLGLDRIHLVLKRSDSQQADLRRLIAAQHTPGSPGYHKWLTPDEFGRQFGPSDQDVATLQSWLSSQGFSEIKVNPGRQTIEFSASAGQWSRAFHSQVHLYDVDGAKHSAISSDPAIPAALAPVVAGFVSLNNFSLKPHSHLLGKASYNPRTDRATPQWTIGNSTTGYSFVLAPQDFAVQYDLNPLYSAGIDGTGQTIAILNESNIDIGKVNLFRALFNLPQGQPSIIVDGNDPGIDGINNPDGPNYASTEAYLDVEWAGAVAPNANIDLVIAADTHLESGLLLAAEHAVDSNLAPVVSVSFGSCEFNLASTNNFLNQLWEQAAAQGITVVVSSGDSGSAGCDDENTQQFALKGAAVNGFASTPYNVAVGGTDFYYTNYQNLHLADLAAYWNTSASNAKAAVSLLKPIPEQPWNDSQYGLNAVNYYNTSGQTSIVAGGGGASTCGNGFFSGNDAQDCMGYAKPAWQSGSGVPQDGARDLPDVSLFAANGPNYSYYPVCAADGDCGVVSSSGTVQISGIGGTSAAAPAFAAILAMVNQQYGRQGQANNVLYPLKAQYPGAFHDVTQGSNSVPCNIAPISFDSSTGWEILPVKDCIVAASPLTIDDPTYGSVTEGQSGSGTQVDFGAAPGYNLATGLGTIDAYQLITDWSKIALASTTTTMTPSTTTLVHGTDLYLKGSVTAASGTPTGVVTVMTDSLAPLPQPQPQFGDGFFYLNSGLYEGGENYLPGGTYNIWAEYSGDTVNSASASAKTQITVTPEDSGIDFNVYRPAASFNMPVASGTNNIDYGTQLALSARVEPLSILSSIESCASGCSSQAFTDPTGTVLFTDNGATLNTALLNVEGDAEYNAPFSVGSHSVAASYAGDSSYNASKASAVAFTIAKDTPVLALGASNQTSSTQTLQVVAGSGQPTVFNIMVVNGAQVAAATSSAIYPVPVAAPTGTVTVTGFPAGVPTSGTLSASINPSVGAVEGVATITVPSTTPASSYTVTIAYNGDSNYNATTGSGTVQIINATGLASTTAATMTGAIGTMENIAISGTVTGQSGQAAPTGSVYLYSSGNFLGTVAITPGTSTDVSTFSATLDSQNLFQGANFVTLQYSGDKTYNSSAFTLNSGTPISNPLADFTMVPQSPMVGVAAGKMASETINLTSVNGFTNTVSFGCTADPGVSCSVSPWVTLNGGGSGSTTMTVAADPFAANRTYNLQITAFAQTGMMIHTVGVQAAVTGSVAGSQSFALSNSNDINFGAGATSGNTSTITVTPIGGFTGPVTLSCSVTGPTGATSPATCSLPASVTLSGAAPQTETLTVNSTSTTTVGTYTVTVTGSSGAIQPTTVVSVAIGPSDFSLGNGGNLTFKAGDVLNNQTLIMVDSADGFSGTVNLTCAVTTSIQNPNDPPTCSLSPASVNITPTLFPGVMLTVNTTASTTSQNRPSLLLWSSASGTALALVLIAGLPRRKRNWMAMLGLLALLVSVANLGCGGGGGSSGSGGGSGGGTTSPGTTTGNYTVTVTGTSGQLTRTTSVTVTVD
jgi:hypothetical protein